jgi:hypothetical protein
MSQILASYRPHRDSMSGFSLLEAMVAVAGLGLLIIGSMGLLARYQESVIIGAKMGEKEDLRRYLRAAVDCTQTVAEEADTCSVTPSPIRGYTPRGQPLANGNGKINLGSYNLNLICKKNAFAALEISADYAPIDSHSESAPLFQIPIECPICPNSIKNHLYFGAVDEDICTGNNLVFNGTFDTAPSPPTRDSGTAQATSIAGMGFHSTYPYDDRCLVPAPSSGSSSTCFPATGSMAVSVSARSCHFNYADNCADDGKALVVNVRQSQTNFWCQTLTTVPGRTYEFSVRARTAVGTLYPGWSTAHRWYIKGNPLFVIDAKSTSATGYYETFKGRYVANSASTELCGLNIDTAMETGDLVIDDIKFNECP